jgi:hypothetical protein
MSKILISLLTAMMICSCNSNSGTVKSADTTSIVGSTIHTNTKDTIVTNVEPFNINGCYEMTIKRDTAKLNLTVKDTTVTGTLAYKWFEKDNNTGTIKGVLRNNIIVADYTFHSEGTTSVREVIFKIQNGTILQASGDITQQDNKIIFTDKNNLQYNEIYPFIKVRCP